MMLFSENVNLFNHGSRTQQTYRQDYYGNTTRCTIVHHTVKTCRKIYVAEGLYVPFVSYNKAAESIDDLKKSCTSSVLLWMT